MCGVLVSVVYVCVCVYLQYMCELCDCVCGVCICVCECVSMAYVCVWLCALVCVCVCVSGEHKEGWSCADEGDRGGWATLGEIRKQWGSKAASGCPSPQTWLPAFPGLWPGLLLPWSITSHPFLVIPHLFPLSPSPSSFNPRHSSLNPLLIHLLLLLSHPFSTPSLIFSHFLSPCSLIPLPSYPVSLS